MKLGALLPQVVYEPDAVLQVVVEQMYCVVMVIVLVTSVTVVLVAQADAQA